MKLVDEEDEEITTPGAAGKVCMKGPIMFSGYFDGNSVVRHGYDGDDFFHTGDVAQMDEETGYGTLLAGRRI
jgi:non-ribosomal peptide synthetase component E (peptide arylation enzyme)